MTTLIRLTIKQRRTEYLTTLALLVSGTIAYVALAGMIASLDLPSCLTAESASSVRCQTASAQWVGLRSAGMTIGYAVTALSVIAGALVGDTLLAVDLAPQSAYLPWTMGTSRRRWLLERALVLTVCCAVPCVVLALASDVAQQLMFPSVPVGESLTDYEFRGWLLPGRMTLGLCAGILAGAISGRSLTGLMLAVVLTVGVAIGAALITRGMTLSAVEEINAGGGIVTQAKYEDSSGRLLSPDEANAVVPFDDPRFGTTFRLVDFGVPGTRSRVVVGLEVGLLAAASFALLGASLWVVDARRPY
jgi:hypothetical protein